MRMLFLSLFLVSRIALGGVEDFQQLAKSSNVATPTLELYSSESCSSCPPVDRWFATLRNDPNVFHSYVPLAFHVDYWNHLNWVDQFASSSITKRQQHLAKRNACSVYTPGVFLAGKEWRKWREGKKLNLGFSKENVGVVKVLRKGGNQFRITFSSSAKGLHAHLALLGFGVTTNVKSGENSGRKLEHNFLVLEWKNKSLVNGKAEFILAVDPSKEKIFGIAGWVEDSKGNVIQATGAYL